MPEIIDTSSVTPAKNNQSGTFTEMDIVTAFVSNIIGIAGNPNASDVHSFGLEESMEFY